MKGMRVGGEGETVEVDGGYLGGYAGPADYRENRRRTGPGRSPTRATIDENNRLSPSDN